MKFSHSPQLIRPITNVWRRLPGWGKLVTTVIIAGLMVLVFLPKGKPSLPTASVQSGEFVIDLKETGKLRAENSVTISAPPVRTNLQIVWLIPEGAQVQEGDVLIQFDSTDMVQKIDDDQSEVDIARSNLNSTLANNASKMASLESALENARYSYQLSQLHVKNLAFESEVQQQEGQLQLFQSELSLKQAQGDIVTQKQLDSAEVRMLELKIRQAENALDKSRKELDKLTMRAPAPGLVVYKETWKGSDMAKIKVGDNPWRGAALLEIPDLAVMQVETSVNEVDVSKVKVGLDVEVKLDAYPDPTFHGTVTDVAALAHNEGGSEAQIFDVIVRLKESDPILRPGMSATAKIIVDRQPDKIWVPIESVFESDGDKVVYIADGSGWKKSKVTIGSRNDNCVVMASGVATGERVALVDPTLEPVTEGKSKQESGKPENDQPQAAVRSQIKVIP